MAAELKTLARLVSVVGVLMSLTDFIQAHRADLVEDWTRYARELQPEASRLSEDQLRNSAAELLDSVVANMRVAQSESQRKAKSLGAKVQTDAAFDAVSILHADDRRALGFRLDDVVAEFRALRASVLRRWQTATVLDEHAFQEMIRFNEAIDQALSESVQQFSMQVDRSRDLFAGVLAHDLRAPLSVLQSSADVLLRDNALSPSSLRAVAYAQRAATRMRTMIDDLLIFTRSRLGRSQPIHATPQSMQALCGSAIDEAHILFPEASIDTNYRGDLNGRWDAGQIGQLLSNLLSNAARYGDGTINLSVADQGERLELIVSNGGNALPPHSLPTLFDPLTRVSDHAERRPSAAGIGLGLFICRSIVTSHEGTIRVDSNAEKTTFTIRLPRFSQPAAAPPGN